jgi:ribonuclease Z
MKAEAQFITVPTADTPGTCLILSIVDKRYVIGNLAEGTQRACIQTKMPLSKVEDILVTGKTDWKTCGGMLGMVLTLADVVSMSSVATAAHNRAQALKGNKADAVEEKRRLRIHGTDNLTHLFATSRRFVFRKGMPLDIVETSQLSRDDVEKPTWEDDWVRVWAMDAAPVPQDTRHSRKRSHEEISSDEAEKFAASSASEESEASREERYRQIRQGVVGDMFDSNWSLDALSEMKLSQVQMPAEIFVRNAAGHIEKYEGLLPGGSEAYNDINVLVRKPWPGATIKSLPPTKPSEVARSYIVKMHPQRGSFRVEEAKKLGVKPGPSYAKLANFQSVTLDDGRVITPEMVLSPTKPGRGLAVVELPSADYIIPMLQRPEWSTASVMEGLNAIVWTLGKGVYADERIQSFMREHSEIQHIISSADKVPNNMAFTSVANMAVKHHLIAPEHFPIPAHENDVTQQMEDAAGTPAAVGLEIKIEPTFSISKNLCSKPFNPPPEALSRDFWTDDSKPKGEIPEDFPVIPDEAMRLARETYQKITSPQYLEKLEGLQSDIPRRDAELISLGTGSALPSKYRNVSATLLRVPGVGSYLFDAGENTLGQLKRVFGKELPEVLKELKVIWISHLHADHHLGTASVIKAWNEATSGDEETSKNQLLVSSDLGMLDWLREYAQAEEFGYSRLRPLVMNSVNEYAEHFDAASTAAFGLSSIEACPVNHCKGALAVILRFPDGFGCAYSGDCRPSERFARLAQGATVLIHEATFEDELRGDAVAKKHSTTAEALSIAKKMQARCVLLTHFSQRYQKFPVMGEAEKQVVVVAFDYMRVKVGDFAKLAEYTPALVKLYEIEEREKEREKELRKEALEKEREEESRLKEEKRKAGEKKKKEKKEKKQKAEA